MLNALNFIYYSSIFFSRSDYILPLSYMMLAALDFGSCSQPGRICYTTTQKKENSFFFNFQSVRSLWLILYPFSRIYLFPLSFWGGFSNYLFTKKKQEHIYIHAHTPQTHRHHSTPQNTLDTETKKKIIIRWARERGEPN